MTPFNARIPFLKKPLYITILIVFACVTLLPFCLYKYYVANKYFSKITPSIYLALTFIFATRNSVVALLTGLSYENQLILHKFFTYMTFISGWLHGIEYIVKNSLLP